MKRSISRILVVDDELIIADTLAAILEHAGFKSTAVYSGADAVREALRLKPDVVICDVIMPDMNGIDASIEIRKALPSCKILLFSGQFATAELLQQARSSGHDFELLAKPIHPQDILDKLR
jgi:CheY-like chemotaxis protein